MLLCVSSKAMGTCSQNIEWKKEQLGAFFRIRKGPQIFGWEEVVEGRGGRRKKGQEFRGRIEWPKTKWWRERD